MSSFIRSTRNPITNKVEEARWLDGLYAPGQYAIRFKDGKTYSEPDLEQAYIRNGTGSNLSNRSKK